MNKKICFFTKLTLDDILLYSIQRGVLTVYFAGNGNTGMSAQGISDAIRRWGIARAKKVAKFYFPSVSCENSEPSCSS